MTGDEIVAGARERLPENAPAPASPGEIAEAEERLGFALPPLLRRMYGEVANGAWGPEYGANGLIGGARVDLPDRGAVEWYRISRDAGADPEDPAWPGWPERLLAVTTWGCAIWSCVDCSSEEGRIVRFDPNGFGPGVPSWEGAWSEERPTLAAFLSDWLEGRLGFMTEHQSATCPTPRSFEAGWRV